MFVDIPKIAINHHAMRPNILRSRAHQAAPTSRVQAFGLRDKYYAVLLDAVGKVLGRFGSCGVAGFDHLHCVCWAEDFGLAGLLERREHFYAVEIAAIRDF